MYSKVKQTTGLDNPLIVVGMPRSGSTIFTRLLNESPDLLAINDFYYLQYVDAIDGFKKNDNSTKNKLVKYTLDLIKERIKRPTSTGIGCGLPISPEEEIQIEKFAQQYCYSDRQEDWASILSHIMQFSGNLLEKKRWGYNTPQDYLNIEILQQKFPKSKFIFIMRDPRYMLRSYKYITNNDSHNNKSVRYHPIIQSLAWRTSIRSFFQYQKQQPENFLLVRYEDLVFQTQEILSQVSEFADIKFPSIDLDDFGNNSSFQDKHMRQLRDTEVWLCEKIAGREMEEVGYSISNKKPRFKDIYHLLVVTFRVIKFYLQKTFTSEDTRKRIIKFAKKTVT